jgi:nanoRNase/pAp phosphatase (c-di-AMP/oligoRNAs hydrolase)
MKKLATVCSKLNIEEILAMPDVKEREKVYFEQVAPFKEMLQKVCRAEGNVIIADLRGIEDINAGNRFLMYTMFPEQNISIWIVDGKGKQNCVITVGYSILNRSATVDVGKLVFKYGGGGHTQVGTCQVPYDEADKVIAEIISACKG